MCVDRGPRVRVIELTKMTDSKIMKDEEDLVVKEIPVYLSQTLADKLFIFQYPIKPAAQGYDNSTFLRSAIKPENQEIELEVSLDTDSVNYDANMGEQIALNIDGPLERDIGDENNDRMFQSQIMDKIVLQSSRAMADCSNYSIGVFQDGELHITPVKGIVQLRPQFNYLDKDRKQMKNASGKKQANDSDEEEMKQVNVKFTRQKSELSKKIHEQSFQTHAKKCLEEQWIQTDYRDALSTQAELTRLEMFCSSNEASANNLELTAKEYLDLLAPPVKYEEHSKSNMPLHGSSMNYVRTLPLLDQVRSIMKDAKVISFLQLRSIISSEHDTSTILKYLQQVAVLVQGNWVVNSDLVYPKDELMYRARDYVLLSFTENEYVNRKAISAVIKLPAEDIKDIFVNLGRSKPQKGWRLIIPPDTDFPNRYPEIAQRQEMFWEAKRKQLKEAMGAQNAPPSRQRRKSNRESIGTENEERNIGRGRKSLRDSSTSDDGTAETVKMKKSNRSRKVSETT